MEPEREDAVVVMQRIVARAERAEQRLRVCEAALRRLAGNAVARKALAAAGLPVADHPFEAPRPGYGWCAVCFEPEADHYAALAGQDAPGEQA